MFRDLYREGYERDPEGFTRRLMELSDEITRQQAEQLLTDRMLYGFSAVTVDGDRIDPRNIS